MKLHNYLLMTAAVMVSMLTYTSCIEETLPTSGATEEQVSNSTTATEALTWAMPYFFNVTPLDDYHFKFGYGAIMRMRDAMTADMTTPISNYNWFSPFSECVGLNKTSANAGYTWGYYYGMIQKANVLIAAVDSTSALNEQKGYLGVAFAFRALAYMDLARMYEFLPNAKTTGEDSLTVSITTETTTPEDSRNNPRVKRSEMCAFILKDLDDAERLIPNLTLESPTLPHLDAVYGLKARLYLWMEDYPQAEKYARMAITAASDRLIFPMDEEDMTNTETGFNNPSLWIWAASQTEESATVRSGIVNWTSWMSNETVFGYAGGGGVTLRIDAGLYSKIYDTDPRKLLFVAPEGSPLYGKSESLNGTNGLSYGPYASLKFRPNKGKWRDYKEGGASSYPVMRVEEMYLIEAEAAAHQTPTHGAQLLTTFMRAWRDRNYSCTVSTKDDVVNEVILQKRIELWGEGQTYFDIKRLNLSVVRNYKGTNVENPNELINTVGRPAWMNFVIPQSEEDNNTAIVGHNNPDPSGIYDDEKAVN